MTSTSPASMGGPLSEAELAQARTYVKHRESYGGISVANLTMLQRLLAEVDRLRTANRVLEGQLATARALHQPVIGGVQVGRLVKQVTVCSSCSATQWPCEDAVALGLDGGDPDGR